MDPSRYPESRCPTHKGLDSSQLQTTDLAFELHRLFNEYPCSLTTHRASASYPLNMAPTQYTTMYNPIGIFSAQGDWYQLPAVRSIIRFTNPVLTETS